MATGKHRASTPHHWTTTRGPLSPATVHGVFVRLPQSNQTKSMVFCRQISDFVAMSRLPKKNTSFSFCFSGMFLFFPKVLRTMGSQDWWFGDPKPLLYTSKPQWLSGTRRFKVVYGGRDSHLQGSLNHPKKVTSRIWINLRIPNHRAPKPTIN